MTYKTQFYEAQMAGAYQSAKIYAAYICQTISLSSVADVGCGRGVWLKAFREAGVKRVVGFDGPWNTQSDMVDQSIIFQAYDLNRRVEWEERFDLALSLEVAEHLKAASAMTLVASLTGLSDLVLFGAAIRGQGGKDHINEQPPTYWAGRFASAGYVPFDMVRQHFWGDERIEFWYRQNTFLYARKGSGSYSSLLAGGLNPIENVAFMDCIHPVLYMAMLKQRRSRINECKLATRRAVKLMLRR